jgi:tripartite-type tricarboxylate transporter receptor subunit TctC
MSSVGWLRSACVFVFAVLSASSAWAAESLKSYPDHVIRLIVPYPAGGGADYWGQLVGKKLSEALGQTVVIDNIPGAGGNNGTSAAAKAPADGYTLLLGSVGPLAVHPFTYAKLAFKPKEDFAPIALLESSPILLVAGTDVQATSAAELINTARANPGQLSYASNGNGSPEQIAGELFKNRLGVNIRHLPFDGAGPARKAVVANQASLMFDPCKGALPAVRQGKQKALAVAASERLPGIPQVPTFAEIGLPRYELRIWTGVLAPQPIIEKLNTVIQAILRTPDIQKEISDEGGRVGATTPKGFAAFIESERKRWSRYVDETGVTKVPAAANTATSARKMTLLAIN